MPNRRRLSDDERQVRRDAREARGRDAIDAYVESIEAQDKPHVKVVRPSDIRRCPKTSLSASHYRDDGTCKCEDPT